MVLFLLVFNYLLILFRIAWWISAGKELISWLSVFAVLLYAVWSVCVPFPYLIVSVPDHCLSIYFIEDTHLSGTANWSGLTFLYTCNIYHTSARFATSDVTARHD